jgi:energy-coupling factor transporter ATP-binding protein EcfA2
LVASSSVCTRRAADSTARRRAGVVLVTHQLQYVARADRVLVLGADGAPKAGRPVTFAVTGGTATLSPALDSTDATGLASTTLTLGATAWF